MSYISHLPESIMDTINSELRDGERIVWASQQNPKRFVGGYLIKGAIPFLWTITMALFFMMSIDDFQWSHVSTWTGFQWVFVGVAAIGPLGVLATYLAFKTNRPTIYFITDRRAVAMSGKNFTRIASYTPEQLNNVHRIEHPDGSGDLEFERIRQIDGSREIVICLHGFYGVRNVRFADDQLTQLRQRATP